MKRIIKYHSSYITNEIYDDFYNLFSGRIEFYKNDINDKYNVLISNCTDRILYYRNDLEYKERMLKNISPENTLKRGFALISKNGKIVADKKELKSKDNINIKFHKGDVDATVNWFDKRISIII